MRLSARIGCPRSTEALHFVLTAGALIGLFSVYGVAQERIMTRDYASDGLLFTDTGAPLPASALL